MPLMENTLNDLAFGVENASGCNDYGLKIEHRDIGKDALRGK